MILILIFMWALGALVAAGWITRNEGWLSKYVVRSGYTTSSALVFIFVSTIATLLWPLWGPITLVYQLYKTEW